MATPAIYSEDFLLETETARRLYHGYAQAQPIIDYHCHLPPDRIARNHRFSTITEIWLEGDHYKWRAMRSNGVPERFCTGDAGDYKAATTQVLEENHVTISATGIRFNPVVQRYAWPAELDLMARIAGLRLHERWGGWSGEPFTKHSELAVSVWGR